MTVRNERDKNVVRSARKPLVWLSVVCMITTIFAGVVSADMENTQPNGDDGTLGMGNNGQLPMSGETYYKVKVRFLKVIVINDGDEPDWLHWPPFGTPEGEGHFDWTVNGVRWWSGEILISSGKEKTVDKYVFDGKVKKGDRLSISVDGWEQDPLWRDDLGDYYFSWTVNSEEDHPVDNARTTKNMWKISFVIIVEPENPTPPPGKKNRAPPAPTITYLGDRVIGSHPTVTWEESEDPDGDDVTYTVKSWDSKSRSWDFECEGISETSCKMDRRNWQGGEYGSWKVRAHDGVDWSSWSPSSGGDFFATNDPPETPKNLAYSKEQIWWTDKYKIKVEWAESKGNDDYVEPPYDTVTYYVQSRYKGRGSWTREPSCFGITARSCYLTSRTWYKGDWGEWRIQAYDTHQYSSFSVAVRFYTVEPPDPPERPSGPTTGYIGASYTFTTVSDDPAGENIMYTFVWGDGTETSTSLVMSGSPVSKSHIWHSPGTYYVKAFVTTADGVSSDFSPSITVRILSNLPPYTPSRPSGDTSGLVGTTYTYSTKTTDPNNDKIKYYFSWGDGGETEVPSVGYLDSGAIGQTSHSWSQPGTYCVKARAIDTKGSESGWSDCLSMMVDYDHPYIVSDSITFSPNPEMGTYYEIHVPVRNPLSTVQTVHLDITESGADIGLGDHSYDSDQYHSLGPYETHTFTFAIKHEWNWLKDFNAGDTRGGWAIGVVISFLSSKFPALEVVDMTLTAQGLIEALESYNKIKVRNTFAYRFDLLDASFTKIDEVYGKSVNVRVPWWKVGGFNNFVWQYQLGGILTGVAIATFWCPPCAAAAGWGEVVAIALAEAGWLLATDPHLDYKELSYPEFLAISEFENLTQNPFTNLTRYLIQLEGYFGAYSQSIEKYHLARLSNDTYWEGKQLDQSIKYLGEIIGLFDGLEESANEALDELEDESFDFTDEILTEVKDSLLTDGLPDFEEEFLIERGYSDQEIANLTGFLVGWDDSFYKNHSLFFSEIESMEKEFGNQLELVQELRERYDLPPEITISGVKDEAYYNNSVTLRYSVEDDKDPHPTVIVTPDYANGTLFDDEGVFSIRINATDNKGNSAHKNLTFTIVNIPPIAEAGPHQAVLEDLRVFFDASETWDTPGDKPNLLYEWDFDEDGLYDDGVGVETVWIWPNPGDYTIGLKVTDNDGVVDTDTTTVKVHEKKPADVICVPFVASDPTVPHETWHGGTVILKGMTKGYGASQYRWDFGDGSGTGWRTISDIYALEERHVYRGEPGTPFKATLHVKTWFDEYSSDDYHIVIRERTLEVERRVFVDDALWWLHKEMRRGEYAGGVEYGYWDSPYWPNNWNAAHTGAAVQALENNGHLPGGDETEDPYVETVRRGVNYLLAHAHTYHISASGQRGDPDSNDNGIGLVIFTDPDEALYEAGITLMAVASSGDPDRIAEVSIPNVHNRRYGDIVRDMVDWIVFAQVDSGWGRGGWGYNPYRGGRARPDNSVSQWPIIGLEAAETNFGIAAPDWVKSELRDYWLRRTQNANGGFGYTNSGEWVNVAKTGAGIAMLKYSGVPVNDNRIQRAIGYLNTHWNDQGWSNEHLGSYYSMYGIMKGMMIAPEIEYIGSHDWFEEYVQYIVDRRYPDGYVEDTTWLGVHYAKRDLVTAWAILVLTKEVFSAPPVAVADASPKDVGKDQDVCFDGSGSYHPNPGRHIVKYEWDFDKNGGVDWDDPDGIGVRVCHSYSDYDTYVVTLRVTDDGIPPLTDTTEITITVTLHNHAPVSDPDGPYKGFLSYPVTISGIESYDPDELMLNDTIVAYAWELDGIYPYDFNEATTEIASWAWHSTGTHNIGLRVTDNYGLTHTKWTTVTVVENIRPVAQIGGPYVAGEGSPVTFDGSESYDEDGTIVRFDWNLDGDNIFEKVDVGPNPSETWYDDYLGEVCLRVTDNGGGISIACTNLEVINVAPVADAGPDRTGNVGLELTLAGSATDPGNDTLTYDWDFGDGKGGPGKVVNHTYSEQGIYVATLTVTDDDGDVGVSTCTVYVWRENTILSEPYATIVYSDSTVVYGTLLDDDNETLRSQLDSPKVVVLEYWDGGNWDTISTCVLDSSDDSAYELEFPLTLPQTGFDLPSGTYELRFRFLGDAMYNSTEAHGSLIVVREDLVLSDPTASIVYSDDAIIHVTMFDDDGNLLLHQTDLPKTVYLEYYNGTQWIIISQDTMDSGSDFELEFYLCVPHFDFDEPAGIYEIRAVFYGDRIYNMTVTNGTLIILKESVMIAEPGGTLVYSDDLTVVVQVEDDDGDVILHEVDEPKTLYIEYTLDGLTWIVLDEQILNESRAVFRFGIPEQLDLLPGSYSLRVRFDGDDRYNSGMSEGEFTIIKEDTVLLDPSCTVMYGEKVTTYVLLIDNDEESLLHQSDEPKTVYLDFWDSDNGLYIRLTQFTLQNENDPLVPLTFQFTDNMTYPVPPFDDGEHTIRVSFEGDTRYNPTETFGTLTILNRPPEASAGQDQTVDEGDTVNFDASGSTDIDTNPTDDVPYLTYEWDFDDDGIFDTSSLSPYASFVFTDDSVNTVTLRVTDDDYASAIDTIIVTVGNVVPNASVEAVYIDAKLTLRVAGEKWHNIGMKLLEDGVPVGYVEVERYPGDPDAQSKSISFHVSLGKTYVVNLTFDARADENPVNGQIWGANPVWVILEVEGSESVKVHHTFNVRHGGPVQSCDMDFTSTLNTMTITFVGVATDPGSDDLYFEWDWGDGSNETHIYYNNGVSSDPYPSQFGGVSPFFVRDIATHTYSQTGTYNVTLTVTDDDGGKTVISYVAVIDQSGTFVTGNSTCGCGIHVGDDKPGNNGNQGNEGNEGNQGNQGNSGNNGNQGHTPKGKKKKK